MRDEQREAMRSLSLLRRENPPESSSGQADLEVPQIWVFEKYLNLLVILNRKNYDE